MVIIASTYGAEVIAQTSSPPLKLPTVPWFTATGTPPNILLTLDDSGSMRETVPFDPAATYTMPPMEDGTPYKEPSFNAAPSDGFIPGPDATFNPSGDPIDLNVCPAPPPKIPRLDSKGNPVLDANGQVQMIDDYFPDQFQKARCTCQSQTTIAKRQSCANWFSFYRTKINTTKSAALMTVANLPDEYRIGWQAINSCKNFDPSPQCNGQLGALKDKRTALRRWLITMTTCCSTPLRQALQNAGEYLKTAAPYLADPSKPASSQNPSLSCRASYGITMTDGEWNEANSDIKLVGNVDGTAQSPLPKSDTGFGNLNDFKGYSPRAPFKDSDSNTLADIAFHYWVTDLQPGISNNVRPSLTAASNPQALTEADFWNPQNNPATWQHMTGFFIGLNLSSRLGTAWDSEAGTFGGQYKNFAAGTAWPSITTNKVFDLWHAAINSRGRLYMADNQEQLKKAFKSIEETIKNRETSTTGAASSSLNLQADSAMFATSFNPNNWSGKLIAYNTNDLSANPSANPTQRWNTDATLAKKNLHFQATWDWVLNKPIGLGILTPNKSGGLKSLQANQDPGNDLAASTKANLDNQAKSLGATVPDLINWLLGNTDKELTNANGKFRVRDHYLGDIVDSAPLFESARDYGYAITAWAPPSSGTPIDGMAYSKFLADQFKGGKTVYVGANDGMLHAFNADTGTLRFSFMPSPSWAKIGERARPDGAHTWFVNGPITTHHAHDGSSWRTVLVASMGAGAKGLFALDVTEPGNPKLLWEWFPSGSDPDAADVGHIVGEPVVAAANGGKNWIVAFGNGYGSASNRSALFVLDLFKGTTLLKAYGGSTSDPTVANGMSAPALLYLPGRILSAAYAGDLSGKLWRFNLSNLGSSREAKTVTMPLFEARAASVSGKPGDIQPITAKPRIASDRSMGRFIMFGTGRLLMPTDKNYQGTQTVYGIRDRDMEQSDAKTIQRRDLLEQKIKPGSGSRDVSAELYSGTESGWLLDLPDAGERVIHPVLYVPEASLAVINSVVPAASADLCAESNISSWITTISPFSGAGVEVLEDAAGRHDGLKQTGAMAPPTAVRAGSGAMRLVINTGPGGLVSIPVKTTRNPRASWQQIR